MNAVSFYQGEELSGSTVTSNSFSSENPIDDKVSKLKDFIFSKDSAPTEGDKKPKFVFHQGPRLLENLNVELTTNQECSITSGCDRNFAYEFVIDETNSEIRKGIFKSNRLKEKLSALSKSKDSQESEWRQQEEALKKISKEDIEDLERLTSELASMGLSAKFETSRMTSEAKNLVEEVEVLIAESRGFSQRARSHLANPAIEINSPEVFFDRLNILKGELENLPKSNLEEFRAKLKQLGNDFQKIQNDLDLVIDEMSVETKLEIGNLAVQVQGLALSKEHLLRILTQK